MKNKGLIAAIGGGIAAGAVAGVLYIQNRRTIPQGVQALTPFDPEKYLGTWYEIARFDFMFEKKLSHVTASYSLNDDGSIKVINRGFNVKTGKWEKAEGKAVFVEGDRVGMLKVSFFGPFYSGYNVVAIEGDYRYALVFGRNLSYIWLLSREKTMPKEVEKKFLEMAEQAGYDISSLIWTEQ